MINILSLLVIVKVEIYDKNPRLLFDEILTVEYYFVEAHQRCCH